MLCCAAVCGIIHYACRAVDAATGHTTKSMLCHPIRGNRGGGRVIGVVELVNKTGGDSTAFSDVDEDLVATMCSQITDVLYLEFKELVNINDSLSVFATPILPHDAEEKAAPSKKKGYEGGTASSTSISAHEKYRQHGGKKELIDSHFNVGGGDSSGAKERGRARMARRRSFGEELSAEIQANPELLHVRKE